MFFQVTALMLFFCIALSKVSKATVKSYVGQDVANQVYNNLVSFIFFDDDDDFNTK